MDFLNLWKKNDGNQKNDGIGYKEVIVCSAKEAYLNTALKDEMIHIPLVIFNNISKVSRNFNLKEIDIINDAIHLYYRVCDALHDQNGYKLILLNRIPGTNQVRRSGKSFDKAKLDEYKEQFNTISQQVVCFPCSIKIENSYIADKILSYRDENITNSLYFYNYLIDNKEFISSTLKDNKVIDVLHSYASLSVAN